MPPAHAPESHAKRTPQKFWGTFVRKERSGLSWRGWLIIFAAVLVSFSLLLFRIYPFLALTHRVDTNVLVVEGWIHEYAIRAAMKEFQSNHYQWVFTTGGPVEGSGGYVNDFNTAASLGAELLTKKRSSQRILADGPFACHRSRQNVQRRRRFTELVSPTQSRRSECQCRNRRRTCAAHATSL